MRIIHCGFIMRAVREFVYNSPGLSFSFRERRAPLNFRWHRHPEFELTYVLEGTGTRYVGEDISPFSAGDLVLIGPNMPHAYASCGDCAGDSNRFAIMQFGSELFGSSQQHVREYRAIHRLLSRAACGLAFDAATSELVRSLVLTATRCSGLDKLLALTSILDRLAKSGRWKVISNEWWDDRTRVVRSGSARRDANILQYVYEHSTGPMSLARVAEAAKVSVATLCRFFKKDLGCTFVEYVTRIRISQACSLLIQTNLPVYSVSYQAGFENLSNFNRRFRNLKGMTPSEYRSVHRRNTAFGATRHVAASSA